MMVKGKKHHFLPNQTLIHIYLARHQVSRAGVRMFTPPRHDRCAVAKHASLRHRPIAQPSLDSYEANGTCEKIHGRWASLPHLMDVSRLLNGRHKGGCVASKWSRRERLEKMSAVVSSDVAHRGVNCGEGRIER